MRTILSEMNDDPDYDDANEDDDESEMTWEFSAREAVARVMENADFDDLNGVIFLSDPDDRRGGTVCKNFEELMTALEEIYDSEWHGAVPYDGGEAVFEPDSTDTVDDAFRKYDVEAFFRREKVRDDLEQGDDDENDLIVSAPDLLMQGGSRIIRIDIAEINEELVRYLAAHPEKMYDLTPRRFEELVAALFKDKGYEVELGPRGADGGVDIHAVRRSSVGSALTIIQCKRFAHTNPVGVDVIRELYGVLEMKKATMGLVATTSYFTKSAKAERDKIQFRMSLADNEKLREFLNGYRQSARDILI